MTSPVSTAKMRLRDVVRQRRALLDDTERLRAGEAIAAQGLDVATGARCVALYLSSGSEPPTWVLADALRAGGTTVLAPVVGADHALDWATYAGPGAVAVNRFEIAEPTGDRHGGSALRQADLMLVPGLAVDSSGHRLGRGGGFYDRALRSRAPEATVLVVLYDDEVVQAVPTEPHDQLVHGALTPSRLLRFG